MQSSNDYMASFQSTVGMKIILEVSIGAILVFLNALDMGGMSVKDPPQMR